MLGLGALFLSFSVEYAPEIYSLLFGEVLGISPTELPPDRRSRSPASSRSRSCTARCSLVLGDSRTSAEARGRQPAASSSASSILVALATTMTVPVVGTAADLQPDDRAAGGRPGVHRASAPAIALSVAIALVVVWAAIALSYQTNWPVGFFVGVMSAAAYAIGRAWTHARSRRTVRQNQRQATERGGR